MGEVVVRVKLTNLLDSVRADQGDLRPSRSVEADAIVDTGAVRSVISQAICDALGLTVDGGVARGVVFELLGRDVGMGAALSGERVLIGSTVLAELDLLVDCAGRQVVPNPRNPDGPVLALRGLTPE